MDEGKQLERKKQSQKCGKKCSSAQGNDFLEDLVGIKKKRGGGMKGR